MAPLIQTLRFVLSHPLSRGRGVSALSRFLRWQVGARLAPGPVLVDFVEGTKLCVRPGMTGATGNVYVGLAEFEDMAFVLHLLRPGDLMVDIGANVGAYAVLAAATEAKVAAFEPVPSAFDVLKLNIAVNDLAGAVVAHRMAVGRSAGVVRFTTDQDTVNHVAVDSDVGSEVEVPVVALDEILTSAPTLMKIDVEGYETEVLAGAERTLSDPRLKAVILELNGSGRRYGYDEDALHEALLRHGFQACGYDGLERRLTPIGQRRQEGNTLYVRDPAEVEKQLKGARSYSVQGRQV